MNDFTFMDKDLICHRHKKDHGREFDCLMFIEFKSFGKLMSDSQLDTFTITDQMFRTDSQTPTKRRKLHLRQVPNRVWSPFNKKWVHVKGFGCHLVTMSGSTPENSATIFWDKREITLKDLLQLLQFNLNPDTLQPMDWRLHHTKSVENLLLMI